MLRMRSATGRTADWYTQLYKARREQADPQILRMQKAQSVLNDDIKVVIHELNEADQPAVANIAKLALRQLSQRIASVEPSIYFPSLDLGKPRADNAAENRGKVVRGWWHDNKMRLRNAQRARHLLAYACCPITFRPHPEKKIPCAYVRHPLYTFPSDGDFFDYIPDNVIFTNTQTYEWLLTNYPDAAKAIEKPARWDPIRPNMQHKFTILEYCDAEEITLVAMGEYIADRDPYNPTEAAPTSCILETSHNLSGLTPAVIPGAINLDKQEGQFDGIFGMYQAQAYLMSLTMAAARLSIFRPAWAESHPGEEVDVEAEPDPFSGKPGIVRGGKITYQQIDPALTGVQLGAELENAGRQTAGIPAEFGGQSPTNVRTGRRASQVMSNTIDYTLSEAQDILAESTRHETEVCTAIDKAYFNEPKKYFVITRNFSGVVEYTPTDLFPPNCPVKVDYPMGGVDLQNLPIEGGQRIQMGTMSRRRFMEIDPAIPDADTEHQQMVVEALEQAAMQSILTQVSAPELGGAQSIDLVNIIEKVLGGEKLHVAMKEAQEAAQERQATEVPAGAPAAMPGMAPPGMGAESPSPPADDKSMANMQALLSQLGTVQQAQKARATTGSI